MCIEGSIPRNISKLKSLVHLLLYSQSTLDVCSEIAFKPALGTWISALRSLETLVIGANAFEGSFPNEIATLLSLRTLTLSTLAGSPEPTLSGTIPPSFSDLTQLERLELKRVLIGTSPLTGALSLPFLRSIDFSQSPNLKYAVDDLIMYSPRLESIKLEQSGVVGPLMLLGKLKKLSYIDLSDTSISGRLEEDFWSLKEMNVILFQNTWMTGSLSPRMSAMTKLETLEWVSESLHGTIPNEIGACGSLSSLTLISNSDGRALTGTIPASIGNLSNLISLRITDTKLEGTLPPEIGLLSRLDTLHIANSRLTGPIPAEYANLSQLTMLDLSHNFLEGQIPDLSAELFYFYVNHNLLTGSIPPNIASRSKYIHVNNNRLGPNIQKDLFSSNRNLLEVKASYNRWGVFGETADGQSGSSFESEGDGERFSGMEISSQNGRSVENSSQSGSSLEISFKKRLRVVTLPDLPNLGPYYTVDFSFNQFGGSIPDSYCNYGRVVVLDNNQITGMLSDLFTPTRICMIRTLSIANNQLNGTIPNLWNQTLLAEADLSRNQFSGPMIRLPPSMNKLSVALNNLSSSLTEEFITSCLQLAHLDMSHNRFECPRDAWLTNDGVSTDLQKLFTSSHLQYLNLANNSFACSLGIIATDKLSPLVGLDLYVPLRPSIAQFHKKIV